MKHNNRLVIAFDLILVCALFLARTGLAEILPTKGTFRGIYQVNRGGVGRMDFFVFSKGLKEQMAPFESKYIEIEVVEARQPINPGHVIIDRLGRVTQLPDPPLELSLQALPSKSGSSGSFDLMCLVTSHADKEITFDADTLHMGVRGYPQMSSQAPAFDFFNSGYTSRQLGFGGHLPQVHVFLSPMSPGERTHSYCQWVTLRPGEAVPFVIHGMRREPGEYELAATALCPIGDHDRLPLAAAVPINLPLAQASPEPIRPLKIGSHFVQEDEWLVAEGVISDPAEMGVSIFTQTHQGLHFLSGLVQIHTASGELLEADVDWTDPNGSWTKCVLDRKGLPFKFRVRNEDRFSRVDIAKVGLWTVTSRGLERLVLAENLAPRTRPAPPPWGASTHGCRMRIETPKPVFAEGEKIRFFVQAESDGSIADILWVNDRKFWSQVLATVDGKNAMIETSSITDAIIYKFPFQADVKLAALKELTPGKHVLQFSVKGDAGVYGDPKGPHYRKLDGTLVSNGMEFEVR